MSRFLDSQQVAYVRAMLADRIGRLADARAQGDVGASAIELAIITAILVGLAAVVLGIIYAIVHSRANQIQSNNSTIP
jgi:F0F1-type ATP synthase membrane subunit c/vacuolar-type H+-ATPase subunit K